MRFAGGPKMAAFMTETPNYGEMGDVMQKGQSLKRQTATEAEGYMAAAGLDAMGKIKEAEFNAEAVIAQGQAQATATRAQGFQNMFSSIGSGVASADWSKLSGAPKAVPRTSPTVGIPGSVGSNGKPMYGPAW